MTDRHLWVELPGRIVGPSLSAAGLAAWVFSKNDLENEAFETRELQDSLDAALRGGDVGAIRVSRETVERAASLWEIAATRLENWSESVGGDQDAAGQAMRLRARVTSLRMVLDAD